VNNNAYFTQGGQWTYIANGNASRYEQVSGTHAWSTAPSGTAGNAITFTQAMTLDASGNLLVGTTGNNYGSSGRGLIEVNGSTNSLIGFKVADAGKGYIQHGGTDFNILNADASGAIRLLTNSSERARIASNGKFTVSSSISGDVIANIVNQAANSFGLRVAGGDGGNYVASFNDYNVVERLRIDSPTTAGQTALLLWDVDNGTLERVTVGAADSGGTGFKVLRIPN